MVSVGLIVYAMLTRCPNVKVNTKLVLTNTIPSGAYRGFGYLENNAATIVGSVYGYGKSQPRSR